MEIAYLADCPEHVGQLARWHFGEWGHLNPGSALEEREARVRGRLGKGTIPTTFVALVDGVLAGSASLVEHDMDVRPDLTPWLASVFVAPEFRRKGIGAALVERITEEAQALGVAQVYLFTLDQQRLYARSGYVELEELEYRGQQVSVMVLELARRS